MAARFKFARYDFANNLNVPEEAYQERKMEALLHKGWAIVATDLTDVYLSVLWQQDQQTEEEAPAQSSQPAADQSQELHEAQQRAEHAEEEANGLRTALDRANGELNSTQAERDQLKEQVRQLESRQSDAPASVQIGSADQPAEVNIGGEVQQ